MRKRMVLFAMTMMASVTVCLHAAEVWEPKAGTGPETNVWRRLVMYGDQWSRHNVAGHGGVENLWRNGYNSYVGETRPGDYLVYSNDFYDADNDGSTADGYVGYLAFSETNRLGMSEWPSCGIYPTPMNWRFYGGITWNISDSVYGDQGFSLEVGMNADHSGIYADSAEDHPLQGQPYSGNPSSKLKNYWNILWVKDDFLNGASNGVVSIGPNSRLTMVFDRYWIGLDTVRFMIKNNNQYYIHDHALTYLYSGGVPYHFVLNPTSVLWAAHNPTNFDIRFETNTAYTVNANTFTNITAVGFYLAKDSSSAGMLHTKWYNFEADAYVKKNFRPSEHIDMVPVAGAGGVQNFYISSCEVPYKLWRDIYRYADSVQYPNEARYNFVKDGDMGSMQYGAAAHSNSEPAVNFTIYDMAAWCNALSEKEGLTPCFYADPGFSQIFKNTNIATRAMEYYNTRNFTNPVYTVVADGPIYMKWDAGGYRPPTPAEWEQAYTAGGQGSGDADAWKANNSSLQTRGVGLKSTNSLGIYDMVGNAWEWTWIHGGVYVPGSSNSHLAVGGGFQYPNDPRLATNSASPYGDRPFTGRHDIGLRLVRRVPGLATPATGTVPSGSDAWDTAGVHKWKYSNTYKTIAGTAPSTSNILEMVSIPSNTYFRAPEWHQISINAMYMGKNEVSYDKWRKVYFWAIENGYRLDQDGCMGSMKWWDFVHTPDEPVTGIAWHDMLVWCNALSKMEGRQPVYFTDEALTQEYTNAYSFRKINLDVSVLASNGTGYVDGSYCEPWLFANWANDGYRLPTMAEWECATRGGLSKQTYQWGGTESLYTNYVWDMRNAGGKTHPVGLLKTNGYGLCDMQGNAVEALWSVKVEDPNRPYHEDLNNPKASRYFGWQQPKEFSGPRANTLLAGYSFFWTRSLQINSSVPYDHTFFAADLAADIGFRVVRCDENVHPTNGVEAMTEFIQLTFDTNNFSTLQGQCSQGNLNRNGQYNQHGVSSNVIEGWRFDLGGPVKSSPVVVNGVVYVGGKGGFYAIDALTGGQRWKVTITAGVESSACVLNGVVYFGANDKKMYAVYTNGTVKWSAWTDADVASRKAVYSPVAVAYSNVFAAVGSTMYGYSIVDGSNTFKAFEGGHYDRAAVTIDGAYALYGSYYGTATYAIDLRTGKNKGGALSGSGSYCQNSAAVLNGKLYQAFAGGVFIGGDRQYGGIRAGAISNMYSTSWSKIIEAHLAEAERSGCFSQPAIWNNQLLLGTDSGGLYSYNLTNGNVITNYFTAGGPIRSPITVSTVDNMVYFGARDDKVYAVNAATGIKKWDFTTGGDVETAVCVDNGRLYAGSDDGYLYCLEEGGLRIDVSVGTLSIPEGSNRTFSVRLSSDPETPRTVSVARVSGDTGITVQGGASLIFTTGNWGTYQTVTLAAAEDADVVNGTALFRCSSAPLYPVDVEVTELDNDLGIELSTNGLTVAEGSTNVYRARLSAQPPATVTVTTARVSGDTDLTVSGGSNLLFTTGNWTNWQTIVLAAAQDADLANGTAVFRSSLPGATSADLTATEQDNDILTILTGTVSGIVPEGSTGTFQVKLSHLPPASVTVAVARVSGDTDITVQSGANLLFTTNNWNSYQTVTLAAAEDPDGTNGTAVIRCSSPGLANLDVTATENDNDDLTPPALTNAAALSARTVVAQFSEPVAETGAENPANYAINNGITVLLAVRDAADPRIVRLNVSVLSIGSYTLSVSNVTDLTGNPMPLNSKPFSYSTGPAVFFSEPLNSNPGWTTTGDWAFGVPQGAGGEHGNPDPTASYTGTNVYGNNLNGDYANNIAVTNTLTTTAINCSGYTNIILSFRRWLGVEQSQYDHANLQISTNGTTAWSNIWANTTTSLNGGSWTNVSYNLAAVADRKATVYIRWGLGKTDSSYMYCGWNIDDIQLSGSPVSGSGGGGDGDTDGDQIVDWWEELYFGGATNANPTATASNGINTVLECYIAGISPIDPDATFLISVLRPLSSASILQWHGISGRVYNVYWTSNLLSGFQSLQSNVPWTGNIFTDAVHGTEGQVFYRIEVKLEH